MKARSKFFTWGFNRGVFLLACLGIFVTLVLGIADIAGAKLPCGLDTATISGCDLVQMDPWSTVAGIPIAFMGLGLYLTAALAAFWRDRRGTLETQWLGIGLWMVLAAGTITSAMLLSHAHFQVRATCMWCLANGIIMALAFCMQTATIFQSSPGGPRQWRMSFFAIPFFVSLLAGIGYGSLLIRAAEAVTSGKQITVPENALLIRPGNASIGAADAPVLISAFTDLHCPPCRANHLALDKEMQGRLKGKVRLIFRHFPLTRRHPNTLNAAIFAEWAKSKDKFWEFVNAQFLNQEKTSPDEMLTLLAGIGLDQAEAKRLITDKTMRMRFLIQVNQDIADGKKLGVNSTPTWFVSYPDGTVSMARADGIFTLLSDDVLRLHNTSVESRK